MRAVIDSVIETYQSRPRVAVLMSLAGSNARAILADEELRDLYDVVAVATDSKDSGARAIAEEFNLTHIYQPHDRFHSLEQRKAYCDRLLLAVTKIGAEACFYAGFMTITAGNMIDELPGVNAHPADLSVLDEGGVPRFRGMRAIRLMREATRTIGASIHTVEHAVDSGDVLMRSLPMHVRDNLSDAECHAYLKPIEHYMFPATLRLLGRGCVERGSMPYVYSSEGAVRDANGVEIDV